MTNVKRLLSLAVVLLAGLCSVASAQAPARNYYGALDLGSRGVRSNLYSFRTLPSGLDADAIYRDDKTYALMSTMKDGMFTPEAIAETTASALRLLEDLRKEAERRRITVKGYYIVGSSAVARGKNRDDLKTAILNATGLDMYFASAQEEAYFGVLSAVPRANRTNAVHVDIGSGNTKIGCLMAPFRTGAPPSLSDFKPHEVPFGTVSLRNAAMAKLPADHPFSLPVYIEAVDRIVNEQARTYQKATLDVPCLQSRPALYLVGGAAWALATLTRPEATLDPMVEISRSEMDELLAALRSPAWTKHPLTFSFPRTTPEATRAKVEEAGRAEAARVKDTFGQQDLIAGISLIRGLLDVSNPNAKVRFSRNANWVFGFALDWYRADEAAGSE